MADEPSPSDRPDPSGRRRDEPDDSFSSDWRALSPAGAPSGWNPPPSPATPPPAAPAAPPPAADPSTNGAAQAPPSGTSAGPTPAQAAPRWGAPPQQSLPPGRAAPNGGSPSARRPSPVAPPPTPPPTVTGSQVAIWGAAESGKTTFLLALPTAADKRKWTVVAPNNDTDSKNFLNQARTEFAQHGLVPIATVDATNITWRLQRLTTWHDRLIPRAQRQAAITIRTVDRPGGDYKLATEAAVDNLVRSKGLIYLFDPRAELRAKESTSSNADSGADFFNKCLTELGAQAYQAGTLIGGKLPHRVAVCITKFDDPRIFQLACEGGYVTQDQVAPHLPRVADAAGFFEWLCSSHLGGSARQVRDAILNYFRPSRINFFVCSSVGFRSPFTPASTPFSNLKVEVAGARARYEMYDYPDPINVLEPFIGLARDMGSTER